MAESNKPRVVTDWSIIRVRTEEGAVEYRIFGERRGVYLSDPLQDIDKMEASATTIKGTEHELSGESKPMDESEHYKTLRDYAEAKDWQITDMTDSITSRTFLP